MYNSDMLGLLLPAALFVGTIAGLALRVPFVLENGYLLGWWSYILFADALCARRGRPTVFYGTPPARRLGVVFFSLVLWSIFELYNFRIRNWRYEGVPAEPWHWMPGVCLAFATVLPGILVAANFLRGTGCFARARVRPFEVPEPLLTILVLLGWAFALLPFAVPEAFFGFVWGAFLFLLEPVLYRARCPTSLLRRLASGRADLLLELLAAGFFCGLLWEGLNYWAASKWVYTVPVVGDWPRLFEMPLPGYLGFPAFAVEAYVMWDFARWLWSESGALRRFVLVAAGCAVVAMMLSLLPAYTTFA